MNGLLRWPGAVRSSHPTNSFVAIGRRGIEVIEGHDHTRPCFHPMQALLDHGGKMVLIGYLGQVPVLLWRRLTGGKAT